jgi:hypothetical protein
MKEHVGRWFEFRALGEVGVEKKGGPLRGRGKGREGVLTLQVVLEVEHGEAWVVLGRRVKGVWGQRPPRLFSDLARVVLLLFE